MKIANLGLWVSCLVLAASVASCSGGTTGSPIQDDLNAPETTQADPLASYPVIWDGGATSEDEAARGVSYTAGMPVPLVAGVGFPSILGYGWKGGTVTEGAAPDWVKINCASKGKSAFIIYDMKEAVPGRLKNIRVMGDGTGMSVSMYNWRTGMWVSFGSYNLNAGPANIPVAVEYAPKGETYVALQEQVIGTTRIDKIETQVF